MQNLVKFLILCLIITILGFPLNQLWQLMLLLLTGIALWVGTLKLNWRSGVGILVLAGIALTIKSFLPLPVPIEAGHQIFLSSTYGQGLKEQLPAPVYQHLLQAFNHAYPKSKQCSEQDYGCWKMVPAPEQPFAWSADNFWQKPKYSRQVRSINFNSQSSLRLGIVNTPQFNLYQHISDIKRDPIPYYVMYQFPKAWSGTRMCWRGTTIWKTDAGYEVLENQCKEITTPDQHVWGISIAPNNPLSMFIEPPVHVRTWLIVEQLIIICSVLLILLLSVTGNHRKLIVPSLSVISTLITVYILKPAMLLGYPAQASGGDGLVHEGFGRLIAQWIHSGNYALALQGGEPVFYFMPGLRYFRAFEKIFFGDTNFAYLILVCLLPLVVLFLLKQILSKKWSYILFGMFTFVPVFAGFGFAQFVYVKELIKGHAEPLGYGAFILGLGLVLASLKNQRYKYLCYGFLANLAFAISILMRPNLIVGAGIFLLLTNLWLLAHKRYQEFIVTSIGISPVLLLALHNWWFGGQFVLLTSAAEASVNLSMPPWTYIEALQDFVNRTVDSQAIQAVKHQLYDWNKWRNFYRLIPLAVTLYVAVARNTNYWIRSLALTALSMQATLFFYVASGRYAFLPWMLTFLVFVVTLEEKIIPWIVRRFKSETSM